MIEQNYPHQVGIEIPGRGLGIEAHARFSDWLAGQDVQRGRSPPGPAHIVTYCFRTAEVAEAFAREFESFVALPSKTTKAAGPKAGG